LGKKYLLHNNWKFSINKSSPDLPCEFEKQLKIGKWYNAIVPGTVQTDLLNLKMIPDPFFSDNENRLQWIGKQNWVYKTSFNLPEDFDKSKNIYLITEGLDTIASIKLNGSIIGSTENMFCRFQFEISKLLLWKNNKLEIIFTSAEVYGKLLEEKYGKLPVSLRSERVYIRKAQYSFGWDWGPTFLTQGIWRPIYLLQKDDNFIENFSFETISIEKEKSKAKIRISISLNNSTLRNLLLKIKISDDDLSYEFEESLTDRDLKKEYSLENIKYWWPNGYGKPALYNLQMWLIEDGKVLDQINKKIGIRTVELLLKESEKNTFRFLINGTKVFAKGANWIPCDSFLTRVTDDKYKKLISFAKKGNMNILRVWGGGIYEKDIFYDLCDELGLMVWQDFMFACAAYPENKEFIENISEEVKQNVNRLKNHPSIIIWCGNNENEWIWFQESKRSYKEMSGYKIYHKIIPTILKKLDPARPYWPSTPFSNEEDPNSEKSGNRHQWDLWSRWIDYNNVEQDKSLFVTEFGFQAPANKDTFFNILPKNERSIQSKIFEFHNKQVEGTERLIKFLSSHLPLTIKLDDFIYLTQLNQGLALKKCLEHWQSRFPETNGSIIWQLNDLWPVSSWSLIDSEIIPKMSYYFIKHTFDPQIILFEQNNDKINVFVQNNSLDNFSGKLIIQIVALPSGKVYEAFLHKVKVSFQCKKKVISFKNNIAKKEVFAVIASLFGNDGNLLNRNFFVAEEWKHLQLPKAKVRFNISLDNTVTLKTNKPAFFVYLESKGFIFDQNGFILLPGEILKIKPVTLQHNKKIKRVIISCLNDYLLK